MNPLSSSVLKSALNKGSCGLLLLLLCSTGFAQQAAKSAEKKGDPARWYEADSTQRDYLETLKKEAQSVYQESKSKCHLLPANERSECNKDADKQLASDLATAKKQALEQHN